MTCVLFPAALLCAAPVPAQNAGSGKAPASVPDTIAFEQEVDALSNAFAQTSQKLEKQKGKESSAASEFFWLIAGGGLLAVVVVVRYIPGLLEIRDTSYQARLAAAKASIQVHPEMAAEEQAFSDFAAQFNCGPATQPHDTRSSEKATTAEPDRPKQKAEKQSGGEREKHAVEVSSQFANKLVNGTAGVGADASSRPAPSASTPKPGPESCATPANHLATLRNLVMELGLASNETAKQSLLASLARETEALKSASEAPQSRPGWKVASALEALLKQLAGKPHSLNPSTLRTTVAAVDLLHALAAPGITPDLMENPPVRVLAVDDDPISRHAISFTLKKAWDLPELAANGTAGLELATQNAYDAIFLDIQMPGLNGFDLCTKIRETELNRTTPIVFVTCQTDFNARAKSSVVGGQDLIIKPFLTFELALKALTLVLNHRLKREEPEQPKAAAPELEALAAVS